MRYKKELYIQDDFDYNLWREITLENYTFIVGINGIVYKKFKDTKDKVWVVRLSESPSNKNGYNVISLGFNRHGVRRHRLIMHAWNMNFDINNLDHIIDHVDGNKLNNQLSNLCLCSHSENSQNCLTSWTQEVIKGISYNKHRDCWVAQLIVDKKRYQKRFKTQKEAQDYRYYLEKTYGQGKKRLLNFRENC